MTLHCESMGAGGDVVLLHGWGWHGGVWQFAARQLAARFRVWIPELPGHGNSRQVVIGGGLDEWTNAIREQVPAAATWVGWSLGGLIALAAARMRHAARLVLLGTTPRFVRAADWDCAWPLEEFARFGDDVERDTDAVLERFASLHIASGAPQRPLLRELRAEIFSRGAPAVHGLRAGLGILRNADLRAQLPDITVPTLALQGGRDQVVPAQAAARMARALPNARYLSIDDAGHALVLSHKEQVVALIGEFAGG
jgi:pimeloyl-[acyl-carrier protein] methyl ester esterase